MDIDFLGRRRDRVINYVAEKYGGPRGADHHLPTMARARRSAMGRVRRALRGRRPDREARAGGPGQTLEDSLKAGAELRQAVDSDPVAKEIVDLARPLEGLTRADSIHAAGVVIGAQPLLEVVLLQQKGNDQEVGPSSMWTSSTSASLKMDFLGLRNLDVIDKAVEPVGGVDIGALLLDDPATYAMLARGDSTGVFQFESSGMREALRQVKPTEFEDLIALVASTGRGRWRIPTYAARKHGREQVSSSTPVSRASPARPTRSASTRSSTWRSRSTSPASRRRRPRRCASDRQENPFADGLAQGQVPRGVRGERRRGRRRAAALEGHGVLAGLPSTRRTPATR